jgi:hypothetical protein
MGGQPCFVVIAGCGELNTAAQGIINAQEATATVVQRIYDEGKLTPALAHRVDTFVREEIDRETKHELMFAAKQLAWLKNLVHDADEVNSTKNAAPVTPT